MFTTTGPNLLLRVPSKLPKDLRFLTEEFYGDWTLARSMNASDLQMRIQACGWNFIKIDDGAITAGVGHTSQEAIANALRLAIRCINKHTNVVEIKHVEMTQYPWFFLTKVGVFPYRIQQDAASPASYEGGTLPGARSRKHCSRPSAAYCPLFVNAVPLLKELLVLHRSA